MTTKGPTGAPPLMFSDLNRTDRTDRTDRTRTDGSEIMGMFGKTEPKKAGPRSGLAMGATS